MTDQEIETYTQMLKSKGDCIGSGVYGCVVVCGEELCDYCFTLISSSVDVRERSTSRCRYNFIKKRLIEEGYESIVFDEAL